MSQRSAIDFSIGNVGLILGRAESALALVASTLQSSIGAQLSRAIFGRKRFRMRRKKSENFGLPAVRSTLHLVHTSDRLRSILLFASIHKLFARSFTLFANPNRLN